MGTTPLVEDGSEESLVTNLDPIHIHISRPRPLDHTGITQQGIHCFDCSVVDSHLQIEQSQIESYRFCAKAFRRKQENKIVGASWDPIQTCFL